MDAGLDELTGKEEIQGPVQSDPDAAGQSRHFCQIERSPQELGGKASQLDAEELGHPGSAAQCRQSSFARDATGP